MGPVNQVFDPMYMLRLVKNWFLVRTLRKQEFVSLTQSECNEALDPPDIGFFFRYSNTVRMFLVSVFFSSALPAGTLVCLIYLANQYWFDKWMILRRYKEIPRLNKEISLKMSKFLEVSIFLFSLGNVTFRSKAVKSYDPLELASLGVSTLLMIFPLMEVARYFHTKQVLEQRKSKCLEDFDSDTCLVGRPR